MNKSVVIGLDGATFSLLDPLINEGIMPTLGKIRNKGASGVLRSTMPPYTAPAWTTFATGVNPGKHGCYDFLLPTSDLETFDLCNSSRIRTNTIYELLLESNKKSVLINLPNTFPALTNLPTITSLLTVGDDCVFPQSLLETYPVLQDYRLTPNESLNVKGNYDAYIDDIIAVEKTHMAAVDALWHGEEWDFFFYLFSSTDWISHAMFSELIEKRPPKAMELFSFIDDQLQWFLDRLPEDAHLYIISDHGFKVFNKTFYFNKWLEQEGYLATKTDSSEKFHQDISLQDKQRSALKKRKWFTLRIDDRFMKALGKIQPVESAARWAYHAIVKPFLPIDVKLDVVIDFSRTQVCFPKGRTMTAMYINDGRKYANGLPMTDEDVKALEDELRHKLENLTGPDGTHVTPKVYTKSEIYGTDVDDRCPDIFYEFGDYWFVGQFHSNELFVDEVSNKHDANGIFIAYGNNIKAASLPTYTIADVTATLLHDMNESVPSYFDGKVMDIFTESRSVVTSDRPLLRRTKTTNQASATSSEIDAIIDEIDI